MDSWIADNIAKMNSVDQGFDVIIVCTSTVQQAQYWQTRLMSSRGTVSKNDAKVIAVHEDWEGGAGNGLGTLYAYVKAVEAGKELFGLDLTEELIKGDTSVAMYHTAGKGTRLAPLPGSENNNKPGVKLPSVINVGGRAMPMTILEAVIKQTGVYAPSRQGRLSVFWGDQVFIPSNEVTYNARHLVDILAACRDMPTEEEWEKEGLDKYGLIAINEEGNAAQVDKVSHSTATRLLSSFGNLQKVGTSLGSFSVASELLLTLLDEFSTELSSKKGKLDADPHFWMPMTLTKESYVEVMVGKGVDQAEASSHFDRIASMMARQGSSKPVFGCVDVGNNCYWWDYGQLKLYLKNNLLLTGNNAEAKALRSFLGIKDHLKGSMLGLETSFCKRSVILASQVLTGKIEQSVLSNVCCPSVHSDSSLLMNVSARSIQAKNCLIYNIADDSEEGIVLEEGTILAGIFLPGGEKMIIRSKLDIDGGIFWKKVLAANPHSFEGVYNLNCNADVRIIESEMLEEMSRVAAAFKDTLEGRLREVHRYSVDAHSNPEYLPPAFLSSAAEVA